MKKKKIALMTLCLAPILAFGQGYSLKQCLDYAGKNNGNIINAHYDVDIAAKKVNEQIGGMLPQLDAVGMYTDNLKLSTTLLPGEMANQPGKKIPVTFGTKHNMNTSLQLTQKIFDPTFFIALNAAKVSEEMSKQTVKMTTEQAAYSISLVYYQSLVVSKQLSTLRSTLAASKKLLESTELRFQNGMAKKVDVDKIRVSCNNIQSQLQQTELSYSQSLNNLKFYMGLPVENAIVLTDTILNLDEQLLDASGSNFQLKDRSDYRLQEITVKAYTLDKKRNQSGYLPTLSFSASLGESAMRSEFNFLNKNEKWYGSSALNFNLRIPLFDGLQRQQRISQSNLNIKKAQVKMQQSEESIRLDVANFENQYKTAVTNIRNEKANLALAESVYKNTQLTYTQGMGSSLELVQSESAYNESVNIYYSKLLNLFIARIGLEQAKGNLLNYINK